MAKINVLIVGSNGQLGSEFKLIKNSNVNYIYADIVSNDENTHILDITNKESIETFVKDYQINSIVNCAAYTNSEKAEDDFEIANKINAIGPYNLGKVCAKYNISLIHISTDYVFNGKTNVPYLTTDFPDPLNSYGATKYKGEKLIESTKCNYFIIRTAWLYSQFGKNYVKTMINLLNTKDKMKVVSDQIGSPTHARDLAYFIDYIYRDNIVINGEILHFTNLGIASWYDFTMAIKEYINNTTCDVKPCSTEEYTTMAVRPKYSVLDKSVITNRYDYNIPYWRDSLKECIDLINK